MTTVQVAHRLVTETSAIRLMDAVVCDRCKHGKWYDDIRQIDWRADFANTFPDCEERPFPPPDPEPDWSKLDDWLEERE